MENLQKGTNWLVKEGQGVKVHTYMSPLSMFANTSHVIELDNQLIIVDGQFFAPYATELKVFTDSLEKPVSRIYISHEHPDHYIGFGDVFPDVTVYALADVKNNIVRDGQAVLEQRQAQFGSLIAKKLNLPSKVQKPNTEIIDNVEFIFEESHNNESEVSLIIKIPSIGVYIAQDIVYNGVHLFVTGSTKGWEMAINKVLTEIETYPTVLAGHGKNGGVELLHNALEYLAFANQTIANTTNKEEYKTKILTQYPDYGGVELVDIYLNYYLKPKHWTK